MELVITVLIFLLGFVGIYCYYDNEAKKKEEAEEKDYKEKVESYRKLSELQALRPELEEVIVKTLDREKRYSYIEFIEIRVEVRTSSVEVGYHRIDLPKYGISEVSNSKAFAEALRSMIEECMTDVVDHAERSFHSVKVYVKNPNYVPGRTI